jgi:hypothetical protein
VVGELKDARLDVTAAVEQLAGERLGAPAAGRRLDGFVGDRAPLAIGATRIAPGLVFLGQLALTDRRVALFGDNYLGRLTTTILAAFGG